MVFEAAYRRADVSDTPGIAAFVTLFPRELVTESASWMLTYALMLGLAGQVAEAHAWLQRAQIRIGDSPRHRPRTSRPSYVIVSCPSRLGGPADQIGRADVRVAGPERPAGPRRPVRDLRRATASSPRCPGSPGGCAAILSGTRALACSV